MDERVVLGEGDERPACAERSPAFADDELGHGVATGCRSQVAGDPLEALDSLGCGLGGLPGGLLRAVDLRVGDRERRAAGQFRRDLDVRRTVLAAGADDEEHRADGFAAGNQRLDDRAPGLHRLDDPPKRLVVRRVAADHIGVRQVRDEDRPALLDDPRTRSGRLGGGRERPNLVDDRLVIRIAGHGGDSPKTSIWFDEIHEAPVGEIRDRQRCGGLDRSVEIAGLVEAQAGVRHEAGDIGARACAPRCRCRSPRARGTRRRHRAEERRCRGPICRPRPGAEAGIRSRTGPAARSPARSSSGAARHRPDGRAPPSRRPPRPRACGR